MTDKPLQGIKIADFSWAIVGPLTVRYLTDFGAQTLHIESTKRLDIMRTWGPFKNDITSYNRSGSFALYNCGKLGISLNLSHPRAHEMVERLIKWADIMFESFTPGVTKRLGLSYEDVTRIKPDIIMVSTSTQGQTGPDAAQPGVGSLLAGMAGIQSLCGWPDRDPSFLYGAYTDFVAPRSLAAAVLAALEYRSRTGKGLHLDQSQYEASILYVAPTILDYFVNGREVVRSGNRASSAAPHGVYRCRGEDRWCAITVCNDSEWQSFCLAIGSPAWAKEAKFATLLSRKENEDELDRLVGEWTVNSTAEEVAQAMQEAGVPAGVVKNAEDIFNDEQLDYRGHFQMLEHPEIGRHSYERLGFRFSKTPYELERAPCLGEHNSYVYTQILGLSDEQFVEMLVDGVFE